MVTWHEAHVHGVVSNSFLKVSKSADGVVSASLGVYSSSMRTAGYVMIGEVEDDVGLLGDDW